MFIILLFFCLFTFEICRRASSSLPLSSDLKGHQNGLSHHSKPLVPQFTGFPRWHSGVALAYQCRDARDASSIFSGSGRSLGAGQKMATHSSILAWKIKWTEEHGGLQSMESQRVGHGWALSHTHTHTHTPPLVYCKLTFLENAEFPLFPLSSCLVYICACLANSDAGGRKENV